MKPLRERVGVVLRDWKGSDAGRNPSPNAVAQEIDELYQEYMEKLPGATAAILAGQQVQEILADGDTQDQVEEVLREWKGSDAGHEPSWSEVADQVDHVYQKYLVELSGQACSITAGQAAQARRVDLDRRGRAA